ncbi:hypothetical protein QK290_18040 [Pseudarthrobacter sp. AL07]|uniref:hypothetical protein n=1 Tax=unclassified Pseudarthrobacter TaxID=2647000 RepID=UPI00249A403F|nr:MULTISPECIES: hypothetical protein [unclassified Pseudarthrobacter]MDI3196297.1 hypothetical protein [Pseudarthrobacter sp. AL20]MDI3210357.1 hypothetical protein [Pseudarthrobacter sp. AL07]
MSPFTLTGAADGGSAVSDALGVGGGVDLGDGARGCRQHAGENDRGDDSGEEQATAVEPPAASR